MSDAFRGPTFTRLVSAFWAWGHSRGRRQEPLLFVASSGSPFGAAILGQSGPEPVMVLLVVVDHRAIKRCAVSHDLSNLAPFL